ncbi:hypothetical protein [Rathayibacter rathayi]|uniref:hypothetical protein n=1 Tax=Rathayibacter rathayi TaxID=33887 RepID=UPI000CE82EBE|nr:hypothetical protein [Rathayibacter rathayi]PPG94296.1 hypothetical protein C5C22_08930 [Rathayibacter rathayi]
MTNHNPAGTIAIEQGGGSESEALMFAIGADCRIDTDGSPAFILTADQAIAVLDAWKADTGHGIRGWTTNDPESPSWEFILASAFDDEISFATWSTHWNDTREGGFSTADFPFHITATGV